MNDLLASLQGVKSQSFADIGKLQQAQRCVGAAMMACLALWFAPFVSGAACSAAESTLIHKIFKIMGCHSDEAVANVYWFFRRKTFFLFGATYIPVAGVPVQLFETYGLGQFAIHCATMPNLLTSDAWLEQNWKEVAPDVFSGEHAIQSYEQFTGKAFPLYARTKFISTVNIINEFYLASQKIPGAAKAQDVLGKTVRRATRLGNDALTETARAAAKGTRVLAGAGRGMLDALSRKR